MIDQNMQDRFWLWGMKVNALQASDDYASLNFGASTMTVEDAIQRTGATNVIMAGGLPIDEESLAAMPSAQRIICKSGLHTHREGRCVIDYDRCSSALMAAKALAARDTRIEGFHVDDFSSGSIDAGAEPGHLARLQFQNALHHPHLPLSATIYTMNLERPELPSLLPYFDKFLVPLWHADQIDTVPSAVSRLSELSGGKPMLLCLYVYDFGNGKPIPRELMQRHLDVAEQLLRGERIMGLCVCGTCMMDLDWEANHCLYEWLGRQ